MAESLTRATGATVPLLGQIPIDVRLREGGDNGRPLVLSAPDTPAAMALLAITDQLATRRATLAGRPLTLTPTRH